MTLSYLNTRVLIDGKPIKTYSDNQGRKWIEARDGSIYEIEVKNSSSNRVLALISVDGLNVITGEEASTNPETGGYVVEAYSSLKVKGWRTSNEEVKEFIFNFNKQESYAVKLGTGEDNIGAIGVAFFEEKKTKSIDWPPKRVDVHHHYHYPYMYPYTYTYPNFSEATWTTTDCATTTSGNYTIDYSDFQSATANVNTPTNIFQTQTVSNNVNVSNNADNSELFVAGTEKGDAVESFCDDVEFESSQLIGTEVIYYDSLENLKKRGVILATKVQIMPKPFKASKFCPDI